MQLLIHIAIEVSKKGTPFFIDIARKTQSEIRTTVLPDFLEILNNWNIFNGSNFNKTNLTYTLNHCTFRFLGLDKAQKARGAKRFILYVNEANGITLEDWVQLTMRLEGKAFVDFNPSEDFWVHEHVLDGMRKNFAYIHSTYLDNKDFLDPSQVEEIENLINIDDFYYKVYVLGELAEIKGRVYNNYEVISVKDYEALGSYDVAYGIDWGWNHPLSLIECKIRDGKPYYRELVYEQKLQIVNRNADNGQLLDCLLKRMEDMKLSKNMMYYADSAEPRSIELLRMAGFPVMSANKNVIDGISQVKRHGLTVCEDSTNLLREIKMYKYQQDSKTGVYTDKEPVKLNDDALDAVRYIAYNHGSLRLHRS